MAPTVTVSSHWRFKMAENATEEIDDREDRLMTASYQAALAAYDKFASGGGASYIGNSPGKNKMETVDELAARFHDALDKEYPAEDWNHLTSAALAKATKSGALTIAKNILDGVPALGEKIEFEAYRPLFQPAEGKPDWYKMDRYQIAKQMSELGYDPKNPADVKKFYRRLSEHNSNFLKGEAVRETGRDWLGKGAAILAPTAYNEAVRQAYSDEPMDKGKVWRAGALDFGTSALMGGAAKLPYFYGLAGTAAAETARQATANKVFGQKTHPNEVVESVLAMGLLPFSLRALTNGATRKAADAGVRTAAAEFRKGALGYVSPWEEEKNLLVKQLMKARKEGAPPPPKNADWKSRYEIGRQKEWDEINDKLMSLGYGSQGLAGNLDAARAAQASHFNLMSNLPGSQPFTLNQMLGLTDTGMRKVSDKEAKKALIGVMENPETFRVYTPDNIERFRTARYLNELGPVQGTIELVKMKRAVQQAAKEGASEEAQMEIVNSLAKKKKGDIKEYERVLERATARENELYSKFPETMAAAEANIPLNGPTGGKWWARHLGSVSGPVVGTVEASTHAPLVTGIQQLLEGNQTYGQDRQELYKEAEWYKKLVKKNPQMAKALDAAMKRKED